jgi:hypothetical protein
MTIIQNTATDHSAPSPSWPRFDRSRCCTHPPLTAYTCAKPPSHKQFRSRDIAAVAGCEKHHDLRDLIGCTEPVPSEGASRLLSGSSTAFWLLRCRSSPRPKIGGASWSASPTKRLSSPRRGTGWPQPSRCSGVPGRYCCKRTSAGVRRRPRTQPLIRVDENRDRTPRHRPAQAKLVPPHSPFITGANRGHTSPRREQGPPANSFIYSGPETKLALLPARSRGISGLRSLPFR